MCNNYSFETHHQLMSILMYIPYEQSKFQHITDSLILIDKLASAIISSCIYTVHVFWIAEWWMIYWTYLDDCDTHCKYIFYK